MLSLTVEHNGKPLKFNYTFRHDLISKKRGSIKRVLTRCYGCPEDIRNLYEGRSWSDWVYGESCTAPEDFKTYNKKYGNKLAFWRVLTYFYEDKELRRKFMEEYFKKHGISSVKRKKEDQYDHWR